MSVGMHNHIVGGIQPLPVETVHQYRNTAIILGAGHTAGAVFAGDKSALFVAGVAVAVVRGMAENGNFASFFCPTHYPIVWDVTPQ